MWSFGDSINDTTRSDTVFHYFFKPGSFTARLDLKDTSNHSLLATQLATVQVTARHFNLALLQTMKYVNVTWNASILSQSGWLCISPYFSTPINPLVWSRQGFNVNAEYYEHYDINPNSLQEMFDSMIVNTSVNGNVDSGLTQLVGIITDANGYSINDQRGTYTWCFLQWTSSFGVSHIPFKQESDSSLVFEAFGNTIQAPSFTSSANGTSPSSVNGMASYQASADWKDTAVKPYVIITFHK